MTDDGLDAHVVADPRWSIYMKATIPECDEVSAAVVRLADRDSSTLDESRLDCLVSELAWKRLEEWTIDRQDVAWRTIAGLRGVTHARLADFLSTKGAVGIALHDKLSSYLVYTLPSELVERVRSGEFDGGAV